MFVVYSARKGMQRKLGYVWGNSFAECGQRGEHLCEAVRQEGVTPAPFSLRSYDVDGIAGAQCPLVGALGSQGIIDISELDNPGQKWDLVPSEAIGIPGSIPFLMMVPNDG